MHHDAIAGARAYLTAHHADQSARPEHFFRTRSAHIERVCLWVERLLVQGGAEDVNALRLAAAFHDVGYAYGKENHGALGVPAMEAFARANGVGGATMDRAAFLMREHSNKERWLADPDAPQDLVLLMEADLLDEEGAMGLVLDCMAAAASGATGYGDAYARMQAYEPARLARNPMRTPLAQSFWADKQRLIRAFMDAFAFDLGVDA